MPRLPILVASLFLPTALLVAQTTPVQYGYDAAGNMTSALPDGILSTSYNNLNLPETVVLSSGSTRRIEQLYSADGEKLGRDCYDQSGARVSHRSYVGPLVLEDGVPVMLLVDGGYISIGTQNGEYSGDYHFFVGDHQGNVRAVVGEDGTIEQTVHYDPFGEMAVDNQSTNRYLYSSKEWDLNQQAYDFGARIYMPAYSRFTTIDPLCEQDYGTSPYAFCRNNPVNLVDPDGRIPRIYVETGGIGHAFLTIGEGKQTVVYTFGRYGNLEPISSGRTLGRFTPTGEGILRILKGGEAADYLKGLNNKALLIFELPEGDEDAISHYYTDMFNQGTISNSDKRTNNAANSRAVGTYNLLSNNCVKVTKLGAESGGIEINNNAVSPLVFGLDLSVQSIVDDAVINIDEPQEFLSNLLKTFYE